MLGAVYCFRNSVCHAGEFRDYHFASASSVDFSVNDLRYESFRSHISGQREAEAAQATGIDSFAEAGQEVRRSL